MATKKILFFTAGIDATVAEQAKIDKLLARCKPDYSVSIRNAAQPTNGAMVEAADYAIGAIPAAYNGLPVIVETAIPAVSLLSTEAIVHSGQVVTIGGAHYTLTIVAGVITNVVVS